MSIEYEWAVVYVGGRTYHSEQSNEIHRTFCAPRDVAAAHWPPPLEFHVLAFLGLYCRVAYYIDCVCIVLSALGS